MTHNPRNQRKLVIEEVLQLLVAVLALKSLGSCTEECPEGYERKGHLCKLVATDAGPASESNAERTTSSGSASAGSESTTGPGGGAQSQGAQAGSAGRKASAGASGDPRSPSSDRSGAGGASGAAGRCGDGHTDDGEVCV